MNVIWNEKDTADFWQECEADFAGDVKAREVVRLTRRYIKGAILDIGAGSGALIDLLPEAIGIDIAPKRKDILQSNITSLPFEDELFGTVFCTDVLEHLDDNTLAIGLDEVHRILASDGKFIIVVPFNEDLKQSYVHCPNCHAEFHRWGHQQSFDQFRLRKRLVEHGFRLVDMRVFPLSFMACYWPVRYFPRLFTETGIVKPTDILAVAEKSNPAEQEGERSKPWWGR